MLRTIIKRIGMGLFMFILLVTVGAAALFWNEIRSLASIKRLDEYGMLQMHYYGDYGFDDFLLVGAEQDKDIEAFITKRLLKGIPIKLGAVGDGCTAFTAQNEQGEILFSRNFDFTYAPSMQLYTRPQNGYASVSTVNLSFAGYSKDSLPSGLNWGSFLSLAGPYLPFDGMNEKGLAIALLAVPETDFEKDPDKITLNTTTAIRLVLDKAASVEEAIALLRRYNIYFSGGIECHYLLADAAGNSALVEFWDGQLQVVTTGENYQIASNFIAYQDLNIGEGYSEFERYELIRQVLDEKQGILTQEEAVEALKAVGVYESNGEDKLQWSVVYNLSKLDGVIFARRDAEGKIAFQLW